MNTARAHQRIAVCFELDFVVIADRQGVDGDLRPAQQWDVQ